MIRERCLCAHNNCVVLFGRCTLTKRSFTTFYVGDNCEVVNGRDKGYLLFYSKHAECAPAHFLFFKLLPFY